MHNCADDVLAYQHDEVTLPQAARTAMRDRRDANRDRLRKGLAEKGKAAPREFKSQGSYTMKTMVQHHQARDRVLPRERGAGGHGSP